MANILLTERCVRACPYCFAKEHMDSSSSSELNWDNLIYIADFLEASNERKVSLLGGEPSIHPDFVDYTTYLIERNFHVNVFTSGIMSEDKLSECKSYLAKYTKEKLTFTCNLNHPDISKKSEIDRIDKFLSSFGKLTSLGVNIYKTDFDIDYIFETINKYDLVRHLRVGLAHPIPGEFNQYIPIDQLKEMGRRFVSYFPKFEYNNISPGFDCGMPMCIFTDEELGKLYKLNKGHISFGCGPALDIGPDMNVWACFPLSGIHKKSIYEFNSLREIGEFYKKMHAKIKAEAGGVFEECQDCKHRLNEVCRGGCVAHFLNKLKNESETRLKEICS
ncbi:MAG: radical SAM/SPASM domain-containing protein [Bacteroidales bacterium]|nr:radical SAM/SPASM domain-containing protein [Bacteroidales bacterium]